MSLKVARDAFSEARKLYHQSNFRERYFEGLKNAQLFEMLLDTLYVNLVSLGSDYFNSIGLNYKPTHANNMNINDYLVRLQTFFPREKNKSKYEKLERAKQKRNDFVHHSFKIKKGKYFLVNLDKDTIHEDKNAGDKLSEWEFAFQKALPVLFEFISTVNTSRGRISK